MKRNFCFKERMVELREAATVPGIFLENGIKLCFLKPFPVDCMFCFVVCFFVFFCFFCFFFLGGGGGCHQSPELEGL